MTDKRSNSNIIVLDKNQVSVLGNHSGVVSLDDWSQNQNDVVQIDAVWNVLKRNWKLMLLFAICFALLAYSYGKFLRPVYQAHATIKVSTNRTIINPGSDIDLFLNDSWTESNTSKKQLLGNELGKRIIERVGLSEHPEYIGTMRQRSLLDLTDIVNRWIGATNTRGENATAEIGGQVYAKNVEIRDVKHTNLIELYYTAFSSENAVRIANSVVDAFNEYEYEHEKAQLALMIERLKAQVALVQQDLITSERELTNFSRRTGVYQPAGEVSANDKEISNLESELISVRQRRLELEDIFSYFEAESDAEIAAKVLVGDDRFSALEASKSKLQMEREKLATVFTDDYPELRQVDMEIRHLNADINRLIGTNAEKLLSEFRLTYTRELGLENQIEKLQSIRLDSKDDIVTYNFLKREWQANQKLYAGLVEKMKRSGLASNLTRPSMSLVKAATPSGPPVYPNVNKIIFVGALVGFFLSLLYVFIVHLLDQRFRSIKILERLASLPVMGVIPRMDDSVGIDKNSISTCTIAHPESAIAEAYRSLLTTISYSSEESQRGNKIMITSSLPAEAKTTSTLNLACILATHGNKVVVVDCDFRKPSMHQVFGKRRAPGLTDTILTGKLHLDATEVDGLYIYAAGQRADNPVKLLEDKSARKIIDRLANHFDYVLIDSPPILGLADAAILSQYVDSVVLAIDLRKTNRDTFAGSIDRLRRVKAPLAGIVVTKFCEGQTTDYSYYGNYYDYEYVTQMDEKFGASGG